MKTTFTILIIIILALNSYSQKRSTTNNSSSSNYNALVAENQSFVLKKVFPNPVQDLVTIEFTAESSGTIQIRLFNILGVEVKKLDSKYVASGDQQLKIDLSDLKTGVYILKLTKSNEIVSQVLKKI